MCRRRLGDDDHTNPTLSSHHTHAPEVRQHAYACHLMLARHGSGYKDGDTDGCVTCERARSEASERRAACSM